MLTLGPGVVLQLVKTGHCPKCGYTLVEVQSISRYGVLVKCEVCNIRWLPRPYELPLYTT